MRHSLFGPKAEGPARHPPARKPTMEQDHATKAAQLKSRKDSKGSKKAAHSLLSASGRAKCASTSTRAVLCAQALLHEGVDVCKNQDMHSCLEHIDLAFCILGRRPLRKCFRSVLAQVPECEAPSWAKIFCASLMQDATTC